jgi:hypothetical protein
MAAPGDRLTDWRWAFVFRVVGECGDVSLKTGQNSNETDRQAIIFFFRRLCYLGPGSCLVQSLDRPEGLL